MVMMFTEPWIMKEMVLLRATPSFTSCFSWLHFISWWLLPTGTGISPLVRWKVSGQLSGWKSLPVGLASCYMFGHWWHHLFLQIVILTEWDFWHAGPTLICAYLKLINSIPNFFKKGVCVCGYVCVCAHMCFPCNFPSVVLAWIKFYCLPFYLLFSCQVHCEYGSKLEKWTSVGLFNLCFVPVKLRVKAKKLSVWFYSCVRS